MHSLLLSVVAFFVGAIADFVWVKWHRACQDSKALAAANWSVLLYVCGWLPMFSLAQQHYFPVVSYALGAWLGTWIAVRYRH